MSNLPEHTTDLVLTSPPYAQQRKKQYGGIDEHEYPSWTVKWMESCFRILKETGSAAIVIRPHVKLGQISDYVLRTRLALREFGWKEIDEIIWIKPNSAPLGHIQRPRRSWESVLWFGKSSKVYCNPKANGSISTRVGFEAKKGIGDYRAGASPVKTGIARCKDYVEAGTASVDRNNSHPAQFPEKLATWLIKLLSPPGGLVVDPFVGSGTTVVAAKRAERNSIGIEIKNEYCDMVKWRLENI